MGEHRCARCGVDFDDAEVGVSDKDLCYACDPDPEGSQIPGLAAQLQERRTTCTRS